METTTQNLEKRVLPSAILREMTPKMSIKLSTEQEKKPIMHHSIV